MSQRVRSLSLTLLCLFLLLPTVGNTQVNGGTAPYTFTSGTVISSAAVNANFSSLFTNAFPRSGGSLTGSLLFATDGTLDIGTSSASRPRDIFLTRNLTIGNSFTLSKSAGASGSILSTTNDAGGGYASLYFANASGGSAIGHNSNNEFVINVANSADIVTNRASYDALRINGNLQADFPYAGTAALPTVTFGADLDTGFYQTAANAIGVSAGGSLVTQWTNAQQRTVDGSATTPAWTFTSDTNTGIYRSGADTLGFALGGSSVATLGGIGDLVLGGYATANNLKLVGSNDFSLTGSSVLTISAYRNAIRITSGASTPKLSGLDAGGASGQLYIIVNASGASFDIEHEYTGTTAGNRILCPGSVNKTVPANGAVLIWGDASSSRFRVISL